MKRLLAIAVFFAAQAPVVAAAQDTNRTVLAEALFQEGRELLARGNVHDACEKFKASLDVEREVGAVAALAYCHQREGKTASAWAEYIEVRDDARKRQRDAQERYATEQIAALEKVLRRVSFKIAGASPSNVTVAVDGVVVPEAARASLLPYDPGAHLVIASTPDHESWQKAVVLDPGPGVTVVEISFRESSVRVAPAKREDTGAPRTPRLVAGGALVACGVAAFVLGAYLQFSVTPGHEDAATFLRREAYDEAGFEDRRDRARAASTLGITSMVLGTLAAAGGAALVLTF